MCKRALGHVAVGAEELCRIEGDPRNPFILIRYKESVVAVGKPGSYTPKPNNCFDILLHIAVRNGPICIAKLTSRRTKARYHVG